MQYIIINYNIGVCVEVQLYKIFIYLFLRSIIISNFYNYCLIITKLIVT